MTRADITLLALLAIRHRGYYWLPEQHQGQFFALCGAVCLIFAIALLRPWWPVAAYGLWQEGMVATCAGLYIAYPMPPSSEQCSAQLGIQIGTFGAVVLAMVAWHALDQVHKRRRAPPPR